MNEQTRRIIDAAQAKIRKEVVLDPSHALLVLQIDEMYEDPDQEVLDKIKAQVEAQLPGVACLVLPSGIDVKAIPCGGVFQRERLDNYEYEVVAANEEDLKARMKNFFTKPSIETVSSSSSSSSSS